LAAFHLDLLLANPFIAVKLSAVVFLAIGLSIVDEVFPLPFFRILLLQGCLLQTRYA
jgi:hypothetical protein